MSGLARRTLGVLAGVAMVATTIATFGASGPAHADAGCTATNGVTVIVDFKVLGGGVQRGCAINPASGLDALHKAGFGTEGVPRFGNAFVCRIDNKPAPAQESCTNTPPGTFSWTYWKVTPGASAWKFSNFGVLGGSAPAPGSIDGWAFTNHAPPPDPPGISPADAFPPPVTVPPPTQPPVTTPPVTAGPGGGGGSGTPPATTRPRPNSTKNGGGSDPVTPGATTADGGTVAPPATLADGSPAPTVALTPEQKAAAKATAKTKTKATTKAKAEADAAKKRTGTETSEIQSGDAIVERAALGAPVDSATDGGSPLPALLAVVLIAALAGGSFVVIRKRRLQSP